MIVAFYVSGSRIDLGEYSDIFLNHDNLLTHYYNEGYVNIPDEVCTDPDLFEEVTTNFYEHGKFLTPLKRKGYEFVVDKRRILLYVELWDKLKFPHDDNFMISKKIILDKERALVTKKKEEIDQVIDSLDAKLSVAKMSLLLAEEGKNPYEIFGSLESERTMLRKRLTPHGVTSDDFMKVLIDLKAYTDHGVTTRSQRKSLLTNEDFDKLVDIDVKRAIELETALLDPELIDEIPLIESTLVYLRDEQKEIEEEFASISIRHDAFIDEIQKNISKLSI